MSDRSENISVRWDVPSDWTDHAFDVVKTVLGPFGRHF